MAIDRPDDPNRPDIAGGNRGRDEGILGSRNVGGTGGGSGIGGSGIGGGGIGGGGMSGDVSGRRDVSGTRGETHYSGPRRVMSASSLIGDDVRNSDGEDLGHIEDIMLDLQTGRVAYAVLSFGGFLGMGDKLFAVPWHSLKLVEEEKAFVLEVDKDTLRNAPGFDKNNWPDMADPGWGTQIYNFYGQRGYDENR